VASHTPVEHSVDTEGPSIPCRVLLRAIETRDRARWADVQPFGAMQHRDQGVGDAQAQVLVLRIAAG
jgi:hypothetical protein